MDRSDRPWGGIYMGFWEFGSVIHCVRFGDFFCFSIFGYFVDLKGARKAIPQGWGRAGRLVTVWGRCNERLFVGLGTV